MPRIARHPSRSGEELTRSAGACAVINLYTRAESDGVANGALK